MLSRVRGWWDAARHADLCKGTRAGRPRTDLEAEAGAATATWAPAVGSGPRDHCKPGVPGLRGGEGSTCRGEPAGPVQRRGPPPSEQLGSAAAGGNGASPGGQAQGQRAQGAPGQPHRAGLELGQAPQAFHGAGTRRRQLQDPSSSYLTVAEQPALHDPARAPKLRPLPTGHARSAPASNLPRMLGRCVWVGISCPSANRSLSPAPESVPVKRVGTGLRGRGAFTCVSRTI